MPSPKKSAPSWTWPGSKPSSTVTIPPLGNKRSSFFTEQTQKNLPLLPEWYSSCVHKKMTTLQGSPGRFRDEQIYHILCLLEDKLARKDLSPLVVVQIGSNDGDDAVREALIRQHARPLALEALGGRRVERRVVHVALLEKLLLFCRRRRGCRLNRRAVWRLLHRVAAAAGRSAPRRRARRAGR